MKLFRLLVLVGIVSSVNAEANKNSTLISSISVPTRTSESKLSCSSLLHRLNFDAVTGATEIVSLALCLMIAISAGAKSKKGSAFKFRYLKGQSNVER